jgi:Ran GTPase-activating protein (RanGAP) involved in mRNA processing and transport
VTFECLVPALDKNSNLEILDLSYNYMGDDMAPFIAKIISNQSERRDNIVWLAGLRGEAPKSGDYKSGLQSMILRYNDFENYICSEISRVLLYDIYFKSIDLRNNNIDIKGVKDM